MENTKLMLKSKKVFVKIMELNFAFSDHKTGWASITGNFIIIVKEILKEGVVGIILYIINVKLYNRF